MAKPRRVIKSAPSGTFQEKLKEAKSRPYKGTKGGVPARVEKVRATQRQYSGPPHRMKGPQKSVDTFRPVPLRDKPIGIEGPKAAAQVATRTLGSALAKGVALTASFALSPSTFNYKTGGKAEAPAPAKGEKLMKGMPSVGFGGPTSSAAYGYSKPKPRKIGEVRGSAGTAMGSFKAKASMAGGGVNKPEVKAAPPKPKLRPDVKAADFKKRNLAANQAIGKTVAKETKAKAPALRSNWVGAAPTEMQKRGGQRIKRPNLLSLLRKK